MDSKSTHSYPRPCQLHARRKSLQYSVGRTACQEVVEQTGITLSCWESNQDSSGLWTVVEPVYRLSNYSCLYTACIPTEQLQLSLYSLLEFICSIFYRVFKKCVERRCYGEKGTFYKIKHCVRKLFEFVIFSLFVNLSTFILLYFIF